ncbi:MAG: RdgB/HAM1 family non-canonical purine NTP pyrophosphatase [Anderseniella sp.]|jgi:XTP/dITP diphosphohydrolase|nr:RdgB/HAM1 family non-canonical purine NTP pyrophosphatase [Anderseniella sp.]
MQLELPDNTLVVASHNQGKVREISALLAPLGFKVVSAGELDLPEPEETETTFEGNARLKAEAAMSASGLAALSDDSGLCVDALDGAPGIYSARWAGPAKNFAIAMRKVEDELIAAGATAPADRSAHFVCALCLSVPGRPSQVFTGRVHGEMLWPPKGEHGFGYDPVFKPDGHDITFGEMDPDAKHAMSHRALAFAQLVEALSPSGA